MGYNKISMDKIGRACGQQLINNWLAANETVSTEVQQMFKKVLNSSS